MTCSLVGGLVDLGQFVTAYVRPTSEKNTNTYASETDATKIFVVKFTVGHICCGEINIAWVPDAVLPWPNTSNMHHLPASFRNHIPVWLLGEW